MTSNMTTILLVEDDPEDIYLIGEALEESKLNSQLAIVQNGEEMLDYLYHRGNYAQNPPRRPNLVLLDLNMPRKDGREVLDEIKQDPDLRRIPIVVLTNSQAEEDILRSYDLGVSGYITKPISFDGLLTAIKALGVYWLNTVNLPPADS